MCFGTSTENWDNNDILWSTAFLNEQHNSSLQLQCCQMCPFSGTGRDVLRKSLIKEKESRKVFVS